MKTEPREYDRITKYAFGKLEELKSQIDVILVTNFEASFLDNRWDAMERFGDYMRMSPKQDEVLKSILKKQGLSE